MIQCGGGSELQGRVGVNTIAGSDDYELQAKRYQDFNLMVVGSNCGIQNGWQLRNTSGSPVVAGATWFDTDGSSIYVGFGTSLAKYSDMGISKCYLDADYYESTASIESVAMGSTNIFGAAGIPINDNVYAYEKSDGTLDYSISNTEVQVGSTLAGVAIGDIYYGFGYELNSSGKNIIKVTGSGSYTTHAVTVSSVLVNFDQAIWDGSNFYATGEESIGGGGNNEYIVKLNSSLSVVDSATTSDNRSPSALTHDTSNVYILDSNGVGSNNARVICYDKSTLTQQWTWVFDTSSNGGGISADSNGIIVHVSESTTYDAQSTGITGTRNLFALDSSGNLQDASLIGEGITAGKNDIRATSLGGHLISESVSHGQIYKLPLN